MMDADPQIGWRERHSLRDILAENSLSITAAQLRAAGIPVLPVKGIVLSRWIYQDVLERPYADVDLLVPRSQFARATHLVEANGWRIFYRSSEMGELSFTVGNIPVEIHAEFGRSALSWLTVDDVLARARTDCDTFPFEILRIDDVDHFLLLVVNVVKDGFTYANSHQHEDLERLLTLLKPKWESIVIRAKHVSLLTALCTCTCWMIEEHGSATFSRLANLLPGGWRRLFTATVRIHRRVSLRQEVRLAAPSAVLGLALATMTPDDLGLRALGLARTIRRGTTRRLGRTPD